MTSDFFSKEIPSYKLHVLFSLLMISECKWGVRLFDFIINKPQFTHKELPIKMDSVDSIKSIWENSGNNYSISSIHMTGDKITVKGLKKDVFNFDKPWETKLEHKEDKIYFITSRRLLR